MTETSTLDPSPTEPTPAGDGSRFSAGEWSSFLADQLDRTVHVSFGKARRQVIVAKPHGPGASELRVRMNGVFAEAPPDVRDAVAGWLRSGRRARRASARLDGWIAEIEERLEAKPRSVRVHEQGETHDLRAILDELVELDFVGDRERRTPGLTPPPQVTWGRRGRSQCRRSMQLGSYDPTSHVIRIHPALDQAAVPRFFVRYVLFHELLHAALPSRASKTGRSVHHGPEFRRRERAYADYGRALAWQEEHLAALLRSARTGRPMPRKRSRGAVSFVQRLLFPA